MGDLSEFLEEWQTGQRQAQVPPASDGSFSEFFEEWQAGQRQAQARGKQPPAVRPAPRPAPAPQSKAPRPAPSPDFVPGFRRKLRELGHPQWQTLTAPEAAAWFEDQEKTPSTPSLLGSVMGFLQREVAEPTRDWWRNDIARYPKATSESRPAPVPPPRPGQQVFPVALGTSAAPLTRPEPQRQGAGPAAFDSGHAIALQRVLDENGWTLEDFQKEKERRAQASLGRELADVGDRSTQPVLPGDIRPITPTTPPSTPEYVGPNPGTLSDAAGRYAGPFIQAWNSDPDPVQNVVNLLTYQGGTAKGRGPLPSLKEAMFPKEHKTPGIRQALGLEPPPANLEGGVLPAPTSPPERLLREGTAFLYENTNPADPLNWIDWATAGAGAIEDGLLRRAATGATRDAGARAPRTFAEAFSRGIRDAASEAAEAGLDVPTRRRTMDVYYGPEHQITSAEIERVMDRVDPEWRAREVREHLIRAASDHLDHLTPDMLDRNPIPPQVASGQGPDTQAAAAVRAQRAARRAQQDVTMEGPEGQVIRIGDEVSTSTGQAGRVVGIDQAGKVTLRRAQGEVVVEPEDILFPPGQERVPVAPPEATGQQPVTVADGVPDTLGNRRIGADPRQERGPSPLEGGTPPEGFQFVSPSLEGDKGLVRSTGEPVVVEPGAPEGMLRVRDRHGRVQDVPEGDVDHSLSFEEAEVRSHGPDNASLRMSGDELDESLGINGRSLDGVGEWSDGAENTTLKAIENDVDFDTIAYSAARKGYDRRQKDVIAFKTGATTTDGAMPDEVLWFSVRAGVDPSDIRSTLSHNGVVFKTIVPDRGGTNVVVFNPGKDGAILDGVRRSADVYGSELRSVQGRGEFLGGSAGTRGQAAQSYLRRIRDYESSRGLPRSRGLHRVGAEERGPRLPDLPATGGTRQEVGGRPTGAPQATQPGAPAEAPLHAGPPLRPGAPGALEASAPGNPAPQQPLTAEGAASAIPAPASGRMEPAPLAKGQQVLVRVGKREVPGEVRRVPKNMGRVVVRRADTGEVRSYPVDQVRAVEEPQAVASPLVRSHGGTYTAEFGTVRSLRDGSFSQDVEPPKGSINDRRGAPGSGATASRETLTPGSEGPGQTRWSNGDPAENAGSSTPDTLEASTPGAPPPRPAPGPSAPQAQAAPAAPGPAHRPTPGAGSAAPGATPLAQGRMPDVKSQQELVRGLAEALGVRFQYGRAVGMRKQNPGRYHPKRNLVEGANSGDLSTFYHEAGHALDVNHGIRGDMSPEALAEVERLADPNQTPGTMSSWTQGMPQDRQQMEGLAELLRLWFEDDTHARQVAPHAVAELNVLLDRTGDIGRKLRKTQIDARLRREAPSAARIHAQIVYDRPGTPLTADQLTTSLYDQFHPIAIMAEHIRAGKGSDVLPPSQDPYVMARLTKGAPKVVEFFLGRRSKNPMGGGEILGGAVDFATRELKPGSKSLKAILDPLEDDADKTSRFVTYLVARRAKEYLDRGMHPGFSPDDVLQSLKDLDSPEFQQMAADVYKWNDEVLQYAVDGGFLDEATAQAFRDMNQSFVPIHRLMELGANEFPELGGGTGRGIQATDPKSFKRVRGMANAVASTEIVNPLESMIRNAMSIITATERNRVGQVLAKHWDDSVPGIGDFYREVTPPSSATRASAEELVSSRKLRKELEALGANLDGVDDAALQGMLANFEGLISRKKGIPDAGTNTIRVKMPDGKVRMFEMKPELYKAWAALDQEEVPAFANLLGNFAQGLRLGSTTLSPPFVVRNLVRDSFSAGVVSRVGSIPLANIIQGFAALLNPKLVQEWALNGGAQSLEVDLYSEHGFRRAALEVASGMSPAARKNTFLPRRMAQELHERPLSWARSLRRNSKSRAGKAIGAIAEGFIEDPIEMFSMLSEASEMTVRLAEYKNALAHYRKKHPDWSDADIRARAAFESRDLLDFAMSGAGVVRHARRVVPFYGAKMTGNYRLLRALREDPKGTVARGLWCVTAPTMAFYAWCQAVNGKNYDQLPQRERDVFWHIPIGTGPEDFIRFPKPFLEGAVFGTAAERFAQFAWKKDPEAFRGFAKSLGAEVLPVNVMDPASIPADMGGPLAKALIETGANYNYFEQRPIVPPYMRDDRRTPRPAWMESNEYTTATSKALAKVLRKAGVDFSPMMADHVLRTMTGTVGPELVRGAVDPVVHGLTGEELPKDRPRKWMGFVYSENISESEDRFRRLFKDVGERAAEAEALGKDFEDADLWARLKSVNKRVQGIRKQLRQAEDPAERRQLLDELREVTSELTPAVGRNVLQRR